MSSMSEMGKNPVYFFFYFLILLLPYLKIELAKVQYNTFFYLS